MDATIANLGKPVQAKADPEKAHAQLEEHRQRLLREAKEMAETRDKFDRCLREYEAAHQFTPAPKGPSRLGQVRNRGKQINAELQKEARPQASRSLSVMSVPRKKYCMPSYDTPAKALRAAQAAMAELTHLPGDARERQ